MIRILGFLLLVFALAAGFAWLADRPGDLVVTWQGMRHEVSLLAAAVALVALIAAVMLAWWLVKNILRSPILLQRHFRARNRDRAYQSISTGMIAAGAGDADMARRMTRQAAKLLSSDQEPLIKLLDAQAAVLERRNDDARSMFEDMSKDPETRLLGLRGLYMEAERLGQREAARHFALRAAELAPQLQWASNVAMEDRLLNADYDGAVKLLDGQKNSGAVSKDMDRRRRAVLLAGKATALFDRDLAGARAASTEANRLAPDLVPAAVILAKCMFRNGDLRKGSGVVEAAWKITPHPELSDVYGGARPGDTAPDRLKRIRKLTSVNSIHPDAHLALARALFDAKEYPEARREAGSALTLRSSESAFLLLADIEQAEGGSQGKVKNWLAKAVRAEPDPAWTADGMVSSEWAPMSPVTGRLDAFEWKTPMGRVQALIELDVDEPEIVEAASAPSPASTPAPEAAAVIAPAEIDPAPRSQPAATDRLQFPPDDPGVKAEYVNGKPKSRFRLF